MKNYNFEQIKETDMTEVASIYNHYVLNTTATFHAHALTLSDMRELVFFENPKYCTYVIKENVQILGYVLLTQHKKREAYDATGEVTIYLRPDQIGKGLGSLAVTFIETVAKEKAFHVLLATICGENEKSIGVFERNGYIKCAHYKEVGQKLGKWLDVVAYQKILDEDVVVL
jgi:phosphinothricin acetyltransferase